MATHCTALFVHCIDYRFGNAIRKYLEDNDFAGDCDIISVAGAAKNIADPSKPGDEEFVMRQIDTSLKLHEPKLILLMNHLDCGAYGGASAFSSQSDEIDRHVEDLKQAATKIRAQHPDVIVRRLIAKADFKGNVEIEEVS